MLNSHALTIKPSKKKKTPDDYRDEIDKWIAAGKTPEAKKRRREKEKQRMKEWTVFLKEDADWDYGCILDVFIFKLERTAKCIVDNEIIVKKEARQIAKEIGETVKLLKKVRDDNYHVKYEKELTDKYGKMLHDQSEKTPEGYIVWKMWREKETKENEEEIRKASRAAFEQADEDRKNDLRKAFEIMIEKIWGWWE